MTTFFTKEESGDIKKVEWLSFVEGDLLCFGDFGIANYADFHDMSNGRTTFSYKDYVRIKSGEIVIFLKFFRSKSQHGFLAMASDGKVAFIDLPRYFDRIDLDGQ